MAHPDKRRNPELAALIDGLRVERGVSRAQMARDLDTSQTNVDRWCQGGGLSAKWAVRLADYFGYDRGRLLRLAIERDSAPEHTHALADPDLEAERQRYRAWYDHLLEAKVPREFWAAYTRACEQIAETFSQLPGPSSTPARKSSNRSRPNRRPRPPTDAGDSLTARTHAPRATLPIIRAPRPARAA